MEICSPRNKMFQNSSQVISMIIVHPTFYNIPKLFQRSSEFNQPQSKIIWIIWKCDTFTTRMCPIKEDIFLSHRQM